MDYEDFFAIGSVGALRGSSVETALVYFLRRYFLEPSMGLSGSIGAYEALLVCPLSFCEGV